MPCRGDIGTPCNDSFVGILTIRPGSIWSMERSSGHKFPSAARTFSGVGIVSCNGIKVSPFRSLRLGRTASM